MMFELSYKWFKHVERTGLFKGYVKYFFEEDDRFLLFMVSPNTVILFTRVSKVGVVDSSVLGGAIPIMGFGDDLFKEEEVLYES